MTPAARATRSRRSGFRPSRCPISAGARRRSLAWGSAWRWAPSWRSRTRLCINFWGDAAIGFTGMDFETAVRERIPILSCLMNNFSMAIELKVMPISTEKYRSTDISGNYADMAKAFGGYGERVTRAEPDQGGDPARHRADQGRASRRCWSSSPRRRRGFRELGLIVAWRAAVRCPPAGPLRADQNKR